MEDLARFCCQNTACPMYGQRNAGNLTVSGWFGKHQRIRLLYCRTCKKRFSERKGTPLFGSKLPRPKLLSLLEHVAEGGGVRATSRLVRVHRDTVTHYTKACGEHAQQLHDELVGFSPSTREVQCDEKWAFVGKKQPHCRDDEPADEHRGDHWDHVAYDPEHRLVLTVVPGKRTAENVRLLVEDFRRRTGGRILDLITTDDYGPYRPALWYAYGQPWVPPRAGRHGRGPRTYWVPPPELNYVVIRKKRRHGRVVGVERQVVWGEPAAVQAALERSRVSRRINTAFVERYHATDRHRNARKRRKSYCFSKDWDVHNAATYFTMYSYNFCWPVRTLRIRGDDRHWHPCTPAMAAGLAEHVWSLTEWLTFPAVQPP